VDLISELKDFKETQLCKTEAKELIKLILTTCNESESWKTGDELKLVQDIYISTAKQARKTVQRKIKLQEELHEKITRKEDISREIEFAKEKEKMMEKQLEEIMIDQFIIEEQTSELLLELEEVKGLLSQIDFNSFLHKTSN
jgi:hypothetical protein